MLMATTTLKKIQTMYKIIGCRMSTGIRWGRGGREGGREKKKKKDV